MRAKTIAEAQSDLSALIDEIKTGETFLITDRGVPVARLEPVSTSPDPTGRVERLARAGLLRPGTGALSDELLAGPTVRAPDGVSLVDLVIEERRSGW